MGKGQPKVIIIILLLVTILLTILLLSNLKNDKKEEVGELENEIYTEKLKDGTIYFNDMEEAYNAVAVRKLKEENK